MVHTQLGCRSVMFVCLFVCMIVCHFVNVSQYILKVSLFVNVIQFTQSDNANLQTKILSLTDCELHE